MQKKKSHNRSNRYPTKKSKKDAVLQVEKTSTPAKSLPLKKSTSLKKAAVVKKKEIMHLPGKK